MYHEEVYSPYLFPSTLPCSPTRTTSRANNVKHRRKRQRNPTNNQAFCHPRDTDTKKTPQDSRQHLFAQQRLRKDESNPLLKTHPERRSRTIRYSTVTGHHSALAIRIFFSFFLFFLFNSAIRIENTTVPRRKQTTTGHIMTIPEAILETVYRSEYVSRKYSCTNQPSCLAVRNVVAIDPSYGGLEQS
jgi:hypothetical protein